MQTPRSRPVILVLLLGVAVFAAAAGLAIWPETVAPNADPAPPQGGTFVDDVGRTVTLPAPPRRIVAGTSLAVEMLMALGQAPVLRPDVPAEKVYPEAARAIPVLPIEHGSGPDLEVLTAARPDLVILHTNFAAFAPNIEAALGVPVALLEVRSVDDVPAKLTLLGRVVGQEERAEEQAAAVRAEVAAAGRAGQGAGPRVLAVFGTPEVFFAYRPASYLGSMLDRLGAVNVAAADGAAAGMNAVAPLDLERVVGRAPEVIVVVPHGPTPAVLAQLAAHPAWARVPAVRAGRVHVLDEVLFSSSPGPRVGEAMRTLRRLLDAEPATEAP